MDPLLDLDDPNQQADPLLDPNEPNQQADVPGLLQMAQNSFNFPTNNTPEGIDAAQQYARQLDYVADKPHLRLSDFNTQNILPGFGARYTLANNITYEPQGVGGGSGFYMGGNPVAMPQIQGDAGQQLNRLPQPVRDAYGPAVVQHILNSGSPGWRYPGSIAYAPAVPHFEPNDSFRLNRDAWGRGFALGSSDMPHPQQARP